MYNLVRDKPHKGIRSGPINLLDWKHERIELRQRNIPSRIRLKLTIKEETHVVIGSPETNRFWKN